MSTWIFLLGAFVFWVGVRKRAQNRDEITGKLADLEDERKSSKFWGDDGTEYIDTQIKEATEENRNWKNNLGVWIWWIAGAVICAVSAEIWLMEDASHSMDQLWDQASTIGGYLVIGGFGLWWIYQLLKRLDRMEREVNWLNLMLKAVNNHAENMRKGSITELDELRGRLNTLQGLR